MKCMVTALVLGFIFVAGVFTTASAGRLPVDPSDTVHFPEETHFRNIRQLTNGGDNAEAYFSFDGKYLIFQRTDPKAGIACDQIWMGKIPTDPMKSLNPNW